MKVTPIDLYDKEGNMLGVQFVNTEGEEIVFAEWDPTDEQTNENRIAFRKWAYRMIKQLDEGKYDLLS